MFAQSLRRPLWPIILGIALAFVIGGAAGSSIGSDVLFAGTGETRAEVAIPTNDASKLFSPTTFAPVVQQVMPSVVSIFSSRKTTTDNRNWELPNEDSLFRRFFGDQWPGGQTFVPRERQARSMGSGVIISPDGYIVTNHHVIDEATVIKVALSDKREYTARVVGTDSKTDLAVLKIDQTGLPALPLADSSQVQVGDVVLAVGNPFGVGQAVSMGIVSATGRGGLGIEDYEDFLQTDAAINPGNSGGPLVNAEGRLIGINTAIMSRSGGNQGVGFAIPINMARNITDQIIHSGKVSRAFLGVLIQPVTPDLAKAFKLGKPEGALISNVNPNSPAERAGLKAGDVVTKINDRWVVDSRALQLIIGEMSPGRNVQLTIVRDGDERQYPVTLGEQPGQPSGTVGNSLKTSAERVLDGVSLEALTPEFSRQYGVAGNTKGVVVRRVDPNCAASDAGLQQGDVILEVNRQPVSTVEQLNRYIDEGTTDTALLFVNHDGRTRYLVIPTK
jgi:serine protease Do